MTRWEPDELAELARAMSLRLRAGPQPGPEVDLGMVLVGGELCQDLSSHVGPDHSRETFCWANVVMPPTANG